MQNPFLSHALTPCPITLPTVLHSSYTALLPSVPWSYWGFPHLWLSICPVFSAWNSLPSDILMVLMDHSLTVALSGRPSLSSYRIVLPAPHFFYPPNNLLNFLLFSSTIGEGNGNPLQDSCLENPMDGGAWCPRGCKELDMTERLHSSKICTDEKAYCCIKISKTSSIQKIKIKKNLVF